MRQVISFQKMGAAFLVAAFISSPVWAEDTAPHAFLPNVFHDQRAVEMGQPIKVNLQLEPGWELNADAPSFMTLFQKEAAIWQADKATLRRSPVQTLPGIVRPVRLQGTFHYCRSDHQSQCLIKSIDYTLAPGNFDDNTMTIRLQP